MGYDFEALETGDLYVIIHDHNEPSRSQSNTYYLIKGKKYSIDYGGVDIQER